MKKVVVMLFVSALIFSCDSGAAEKKAAELEAAAKEATQLDSISEVLENTTADIEATSDELNNLLNDL